MIGSLIVLVAVVATAILISISWPISPLLLPIYLFKWFIDKLRRKETDLGPGGSIVPEPGGSIVPEPGGSIVPEPGRVKSQQH